jgi:hypothetical protein
MVSRKFHSSHTTSGFKGGGLGGGAVLVGDGFLDILLVNVCAEQKYIVPLPLKLP